TLLLAGLVFAAAFLAAIGLKHAVQPARCTIPVEPSGIRNSLQNPLPLGLLVVLVHFAWLHIRQVSQPFQPFHGLIAGCVPVRDSLVLARPFVVLVAGLPRPHLLWLQVRFFGLHHLHAVLHALDVHHLYFP